MFESGHAKTVLYLFSGFYQKWYGGYLVNLFSILVALGLWHTLTAYNINYGLQFGNIPQPIQVFSSMMQKFSDAKIYQHIGYSLYRISVGFILSAFVGIFLGLLVGWYRIAKDLLFPTLEMLRPVPAIAWMPISILLFPKTEQSIIFIVFISAFFPIFLSTISGVMATPTILIRAAQSLGAKPKEIFQEVVLPSALPSIFTGLAIGMGVEWFALISAEMISGQYGIGYFTWAAYHLVQYDEIVIGMIFIGILGYGCSQAIRIASNRFLRYQALDKRERV